MSAIIILFTTVLQNSGNATRQSKREIERETETDFTIRIGETEVSLSTKCATINKKIQKSLQIIKIGR